MAATARQPIRQKCLLLGASHAKPARKLIIPGYSLSEDHTDWVRLDMNPDCKPDVLFDLNDIEREGWLDRVLMLNRLPFRAETFDEIHAYSVMEHYGTQGDFRGFFAGMRELWRVLKPGGYLVAGTPPWNDMWAWGDPGHTRIINNGTIAYLERAFYDKLDDSPATDYRRFVSPCWWKIEHSQYDAERGGYYFGLKKVSE